MAEWLNAQLSIPENDQPHKEWFAQQSGGQLKLPKCGECGMMHYPPRTFCPDCRGSDLSYEAVSGKGTIHSYFILSEPIHPAFQPHPNTTIALIELDEQQGVSKGGDRTRQPAADRALRIVGNIVQEDGSFEDAANVAINKRVEVRMIDLGDGMALPQWKLSGEPNRRRGVAGPGALGFASRRTTPGSQPALRAKWLRGSVGAVAATIGGGTSEIQRNIIATRALGKPFDQCERPP